MRHVKASDLRNHQTDIIDAVRAGEQITLTRNGRPMAVILPLADWEKLTTVSVQQLADLYKVTTDTILRLAASVPGNNVIHRHHPVPGQTLLSPAAATHISEMLERNTEYPLPN